MSNEPLKIDDIVFTVGSLIERAPHWTMVRELTQNALESAANSVNEKIVHWTTGDFEGRKKAVIWNTGPGMDSEQLRHATNLACKIDKTLGLDDNFGVGAKVSSLANNKIGLRYRSCKNGSVHEVTIGFDEDSGEYVRFEYALEDGSSTVIDVTEPVREEGRWSLDHDWTEVMLLGNSLDQNTSERLFANERKDKNFVATSIYRRFYRIPSGVQLKLDSEYHRFDTTRNFAPMDERDDKFKKVERVSLSDFGIILHYRHDPSVGDISRLRMSSRGALGSTTTMCGLIFKDEIYSVSTGKTWSAEAPKFGIPFGSAELSVLIEISDHEARPSQYRERLISRSDSSDIAPIDFAEFVREFMPDWFKDAIKSASPRQERDLSNIQEELQALFDRCRVPVLGVKQTQAGGNKSVQIGYSPDSFRFWPGSV